MLERKRPMPVCQSPNTDDTKPVTVQSQMLSLNIFISMNFSTYMRVQ